jgi:hypothetical protein
MSPHKMVRHLYLELDYCVYLEIIEYAKYLGIDIQAD